MEITGTVAVTGAGAGLGQGIAIECARRGHRVLALILEEKQRADVEAQAAGLPGKVDIQILDVTRPGAFAFPDDLDVLVNNAGIRLKNLAIEDIPLEEWRLYFEVNFFGAVELTRRAIPIMRRRGRGLICNINSGSAFSPVPFLAPYRATKGALAAFSETLRAEVAPFGVKVLEIFPSAIRTGLNVESVTVRVAHAVDNPHYAPMARRQREQFLKSNMIIDEIPVAAALIVDAMVDDKGRMRHGTRADTSALDAWRPDGGEAGLAAYIATLLPQDSD